ncbi:hypothetical protein [Polaromonas vacuolata]|uniref:hypothetical protein n=1 Tax=Polaromonas vacuolata TaxID=37448 RepID=UPI0014570830|nr:hypothetical protein [Polaromonas vacuolata]
MLIALNFVAPLAIAFKCGLGILSSALLLLSSVFVDAKKELLGLGVMTCLGSISTLLPAKNPSVLTFADSVFAFVFALSKLDIDIGLFTEFIRALPGKNIWAIKLCKYADIYFSYYFFSRYFS